MPRLIWSPPALLDIQRLYRFLASKNGDAAKSAVKAIRQEVKVLALQPGIGRPIEEIPPEFREWMIDFGHSSYVAMYHHDGDVVTILAVRHQREAGYKD
ncbi:type II toxin-antitoxin system RelE/ParE family toxin [Rhodoferax sp.]|uniref:type II toxin-antitoxin system RelE/ParE family toxin n=1 Tax=Rhodoferax sp. TaxID=50421 RepID=UPI0019F2D13E|nr:type II toxin-antitoxin system RelE/ParE family toxin [Rhodoferax sp.]MBE0475119.1 type II toxin-antitoxin system RelE/ParE family toxin [Rhodoferax sp.]